MSCENKVLGARQGRPAAPRAARRTPRRPSKLATARLLADSTLAAELGVGAVDEDALYDAMDWLVERQERIERRLAKRHLAEGGQALYDVSSSYYEGRTCPLARFGHSRDGKRGRPVVVYGLLADAEGRPVAVRAHPGDTADPNTLPGEVERRRGAASPTCWPTSRRAAATAAAPRRFPTRPPSTATPNPRPFRPAPWNSSERSQSTSLSRRHFSLCDQ